jgi:phosphate-selective porin OprO and OprP
MHGRIQVWLARMLAVAIGCGACAVAQAQGEMPSNSGYADTAYGGPAVSESQPAASNTSMAANINADQADLSQRIADLEKALKKLDDKAKADKEAALNKPTCAVGGLIQYDMATFSNKNAATQAMTGQPNSNKDPFINAIGPRNLRLQVMGDFWYNTDYKLEVDLNTISSSYSQTSYKDVYFTVKELPWVQNVRVGHFKEPFGMEQLTSDRHLSFMERSMCDAGFIVPSRNIGMMFFGQSENEKATFALGGFLNQNGIDTPPMYSNRGQPGTAGVVMPSGANWLDNVDKQMAVTMRGTWTPWYDEATASELNGSRGLWHVGAAYSYRSDLGYRTAAGTSILESNYQVRPESYLAPVILNTNALPAVDNQLYGFETALVYGSFSAQGEVFADTIHQPNGTDVNFAGGYGYMSYFLTGENRNYNRKSGVFDRVKPFTNFFRVRTCDGNVESGWGAWEVGYRVTYVDMLDGISGASRTVGLGRATDQTLGMNWYLNPYTKVMANYIFTTFDRVEVAGAAPVLNHTVNTFEMRAQFDF